jgi:hypothetical protein
MGTKKKTTHSKHKEQWKEQAEEMTKFFGVNCFPIFYRTQRLYIDEAYRICKEKEINNIKYFWGCIKHQKEMTNNYLNQDHENM